MIYSNICFHFDVQFDTAYQASPVTPLGGGGSSFALWLAWCPLVNSSMGGAADPVSTGALKEQEIWGLGGAGIFVGNVAH